MNSTKHNQLAAWLQSATGQNLTRLEKEQLTQLFAHSYSETVVLLGSVAQQHLLPSLPAKNSFIADVDFATATLERSAYPIFTADPRQLPIMPESVDTVLVPHTLEQYQHLPQMLRQIYQMMKPQAYFIIMGVDPVNLWGIWRNLSVEMRRVLPKVYSLSAMCRYLRYAGFAVMEKHHMPLRYAHTENKRALWRFMPRQLSISCRNYVIVARRNEQIVTPRKLGWKKVTHLAENGFAKPAIKKSHE
ncbi:MAG: methyltransferase domain-containing protein [Pseudomonadota bacterium]